MTAKPTKANTPHANPKATKIEDKVSPRGFTGHVRELLEREVSELRGKVGEIRASAENHRVDHDNETALADALEQAAQETQEALDKLVADAQAE